MVRSVWTCLLILGLCGCGLFKGDQSVQIVSCEELTRLTLVQDEDLDASETPADGGDTNVLSNVLTKPRIVKPGMVVTILVDEDRSLNRQYQIPDTGAIEYPPIGRIVVEGLTPDEIAQVIKQDLEKDYLVTATVSVTIETFTGPTATATGVVYVLGSVGRPGPLYIPKEGFTLGKTIIAAGGCGSFGNCKKVQVIRYDANGKKYKCVANVDRILGGRFEEDVPIQDGDWIIVPEKLFSF